jgi:hypothetical protein
MTIPELAFMVCAAGLGLSIAVGHWSVLNPGKLSDLTTDILAGIAAVCAAGMAVSLFIALWQVGLRGILLAMLMLACWIGVLAFLPLGTRSTTGSGSSKWWTGGPR